MDDHSDDLGEERAWVRRMTRRRAEARSLARAVARARSVLASRDDLDAPPVPPATRTPSPTQLHQLAAARSRRWASVDADARRAFMRRLVAVRWEKTTAAQRHHVGLSLSRARWHPPPDPKAAPGGGRYR